MKNFFKKYPLGKKIFVFLAVFVVVGGSYMYLAATPAHADCSYTDVATLNVACLTGTISGNLNNLITYAASTVAYGLLSITSLFLGLSALLLNFVISQTILNMASFVNTSNGINVGWEFIRDVGNLIFIFFFIYVAIKTILGLADGQTKRLIAYLIIFSLLVNFSLFFTKIIIDASNILTAGFFNLSVGNTTGQDPTISGMSGAFMQDLGLPGLWNSTADNAALGILALQGGAQTSAGPNATTAGTLWRILVIGVGGSIFFVFTMISFLTAAVLLCVRFVILIFLLILAPVGYLGYILPQTKSYASKWWKTLISQCMFAPFYMILIYLVLILASNLNSIGLSSSSLTSIANIAQATSAGSGLNPISAPVGSILNFLIIILFMNGATILAMQTATSSGGIAAKAMEWGRKTASNAAKRTVGAAARGTVGLTGRRLDEKAAGTAFGNSRFGRWGRSITTGAAANAKFGTSQSSADIDKKNKKGREDFAARLEKDTQKEFVNQLPAQRKWELEKGLPNKIRQAEVDISASGQKLTQAQTKLDSLLKDPSASDREKKKAQNEIEAMKKEVKDRIGIRDKIKQQEVELKARMTHDKETGVVSAASDDEKRAVLPRLQERRMIELAAKNEKLKSSFWTKSKLYDLYYIFGQGGAPEDVRKEGMHRMRDKLGGKKEIQDLLEQLRKQTEIEASTTQTPVSSGPTTT